MQFYISVYGYMNYVKPRMIKQYFVLDITTINICHNYYVICDLNLYLEERDF